MGLVKVKTAAPKLGGHVFKCGEAWGVTTLPSEVENPMLVQLQKWVLHLEVRSPGQKTGHQQNCWSVL